MRIMLITPEMIDTHTQRFLQMLLVAGHNVTLVGNHDLGIKDVEQFDFVPLPEIQFRSWMRPHRLYRALTDWIMAFRIRRIWQRAKPDIVHLIFVNRRAYQSALARLHPFVITALGSDINNLFEKDYSNTEWRNEVAKILRVSDHVTSDTCEILKRCEDLANQPLRSSLFYFGIDLDLFHPASKDEKEQAQKKFGIPASAKVVLSPRRLTSKMQHDMVLKAFAEVIKRNSMNAVLVLRKYGNYSIEHENTLKELALELDIADKLIWLEQIDYKDMPALYGLSDLVVNVPVQDGLPVTLFEASACLTPVITSDLVSYQEFLSKGAYLRVPVGNLEALVDAVEFVLSGHDAQIVESTQKNRELIVREADQRKSIVSIEKIYRQHITYGV